MCDGSGYGLSGSWGPGRDPQSDRHAIATSCCVHCCVWPPEGTRGLYLRPSGADPGGSSWKRWLPRRLCSPAWSWRAVAPSTAPSAAVVGPLGTWGPPQPASSSSRKLSSLWGGEPRRLQGLGAGWLEAGITYQEGALGPLKAEPGPGGGPAGGWQRHRQIPVGHLGRTFRKGSPCRGRAGLGPDAEEIQQGRS